MPTLPAEAMLVRYLGYNAGQEQKFSDRGTMSDSADSTTSSNMKILGTRSEGLRLFRKVFVYHFILVVTVLGIAATFPQFIDYLPVGGVTELAEGGELSVSGVSGFDEDEYDDEIVSSIIKATSSFDRLGVARDLIIVLISVWLLTLPVSWVHKGIHTETGDHSLDETMLILPGIVATIVLVVQHSLALAFSLAGIVAGVQFRRALQDTFDALFILVAIGTGLSAGIGALEITTVLTFFFCYSTLYVYYLGDGLESDHAAVRAAEKKAEKQRQKKAEKEADLPGD